MGILKRLFGPKEPPGPPRDVMVLAAPLVRPAAHLVTSADEAPSHFGGAPPLPAGTAWPSRDGRPLTFLACVDLPSLHAALPVSWLPPAGRLLFFYDAENQPWGFDPKDRGSSVVHHEADVALERRALPRELPQAGRFQPCAVAMVSYVDIPSMEDERNPLMGADDETLESYSDVQDKLASPNSDIAHKLLGHAQTIQGAMELECALTSNGIYTGDARGYKDRRAAKLAKSQYDWRLLLQIDSDEHAGMMWGDAGRIYYWIRDQDLLERRFDKSWLVLQCY